MSPVQLVLSKLPDAARSGNSWSARCPAHDDKHASLSISEGRDGKALLYCHAGCTYVAVASAIGMSNSDSIDAKPASASRQYGGASRTSRTYTTLEGAVAVLEQTKGNRSALWTYCDAHGEAVGAVIRWDGQQGKDIRPVTRDGNAWRIGAMPEPRPLFELLATMDAAVVVVAEGEKAAEAARSLGFTATTSSGGSQAASKTDWRPLAGKDVLILPDNDPPGRKYANDVAGILSGLTPPASIRIVELPGLPEKGDLVDWIDAHGDAAEPESMRSEIEALARNCEQWKPESADDLAFRPFPIDALPEPMRGFVTAGSTAIGCDPSYLTLPLLTEAAAAIGNSRRLHIKRGWNVPPILWCALVGESGTAKTPAFQMAIRPIRDRERKAIEKYNAEMEDYKAVRLHYEKELLFWKRSKKQTGDPPKEPEPPHALRALVTDVTVEALAPILLANPRGLLLARDELNGWLGSFDRYSAKGQAGADAANWLSMFNAQTITVDRKTGVPRTIFVPQAAVCVVGGIQPAILRKALGAEHRESGLGARLLLAYPPRKPKKWSEADIDPAAEAAMASVFEGLFELQSVSGEDGATRPDLVRLSGEAKAAWIMYYNSHADEQAKQTGDMAAAYSKLEEYAARLALVVHCVRQAAGDPKLASADVLDSVSMKAGIAMAMWFRHEAKRVYAMLFESESQQRRRRLEEWIEQNGGAVTAREAQQRCRWLRESGAADAVLEALAKEGRGAWKEVPTTEKGGRPSRVFTLIARSRVNETSTSDGMKAGYVDVDAVATVETGNDVDANASGDIDSSDVAKLNDPNTPGEEVSAESMFGNPETPNAYSAGF